MAINGLMISVIDLLLAMGGRRRWNPVNINVLPNLHDATPIALIFGRRVAESLYFHIVAADPHPMEGRQDIQGRLGAVGFGGVGWTSDAGLEKRKDIRI
jgi:hypothetical protein